jgi:hypothetical protein
MLAVSLAVAGATCGDSPVDPGESNKTTYSLTAGQQIDGQLIGESEIDTVTFHVEPASAVAFRVAGDSNRVEVMRDGWIDRIFVRNSAGYALTITDQAATGFTSNAHRWTRWASSITRLHSTQWIVHRS